MHAHPFASQLFFVANGASVFTGATSWPLGIPANTSVWFQFLIDDASVSHAITMSNGLLATTP